VSNVIRYDEEPAQRIQALSETPEMQAQRRCVIELLAPRAGEHILDVGCGPGHLIKEIADAVGPGGRACGVDVDLRDLAHAGEYFFSLNRYIFLAAKPPSSHTLTSSASDR
jgi:ubiquinone/menaquinone biosynthesis C-methylase UbiE